MIRNTVLIGTLILFAACEDREKPEPIASELDLEQPVANAGGSGGGGGAANAGAQRASAEEPRVAKTTLTGKSGVELSGSATFTETEGGVEVFATVSGAPPGKHGIHVHQKPDCSNVAADSMGSHFSPEEHPHALPGEGSNERHLGDLGNIEVGPGGKGELRITIEGATLKPGDTKSFVQRSLIVHADEDKGEKQQPSGGSGKPIACGVIELESTREARRAD